MFKTIQDVSFGDMYRGKFYTITGAGGEVNDWIEGYTKELISSKIGRPKYWVRFTGKDLNTAYDLEPRKKYQDEMVFLAFPLDGLNIEDLTKYKFQAGDRFFNDIIDTI